MILASTQNYTADAQTRWIDMQDTQAPTAQYVVPTETDGSIINTNSIDVNVTASDLLLNSIEIRIYNSTRSLLQKNVSTSSPFNITYGGLSDGLYFFNATANDTSNNKVNLATRNVTIDTISPILTINSPTANQFIAQSNVRFNITLNEQGSSAFYTLNSGVTNISMSTIDNLNYNATNTSIANGQYIVRFYTNDTSGNRNDTTQISFTIDTINPSITSLTESPSDPTNYSSGTKYEFNATITDTNLQTALIQFNGTNYTTTNLTANVYNFSITNLAAGTYNYYWYANDSANNINITLLQTYTINRANSEVNLTLNNTERNITIIQDSSILLNGTLIRGDSQTILKLYNNGTLINEKIIEVSNQTVFDTPGLFNITIIYTILWIIQKVV